MKDGKQGIVFSLPHYQSLNFYSETLDKPYRFSSCFQLYYFVSTWLCFLSRHANLGTNAQRLTDTYLMGVTTYVLREQSSEQRLGKSIKFPRVSFKNYTK